MKFGGALMKDAQGIIKVGEIIKEFSSKPLVIVVSALGKTTNALEKCLIIADGEELKKAFTDIKLTHFDIISELFKQKIPESLSAEIDKVFIDLWDVLSTKYDSHYQRYDSVVGKGELLASIVVTSWLKHIGVKSKLINAETIIFTTSNFTDAGIIWDYTTKLILSRLMPALENGNVAVTQGFIGADKNGNPTTLGREGSDFTAAIIGNIIFAKDVTIWKNVPGLMNADPNKFENAKKFSGLSYREAIELAYYGASVIHPKTIQPLKQKSIPLFVRSYVNLSIPATAITDDEQYDKEFPSIIVKENQVLLSLSTQNLSFIEENNLRQIFDAFSKNKIHLNMMQNSAVSFSVSFNYDEIKLSNLLHDLKDYFQIKYNVNLKLITLRHYTDELYNRVIGNNKIYLIQRSRSTLQALIKEQ